MKKKYSNPEMVIITLETQQIIAASLGMGSGNKNSSEAQSRFFGDIDEEVFE